MYYRVRWYDPSIRRFISEDPVWSTNPYSYVGNNPINWIDPFGLDAELPVDIFCKELTKTEEEREIEKIKRKPFADRTPEEMAKAPLPPIPPGDVEHSSDDFWLLLYGNQLVKGATRKTPKTHIWNPP